MKLKNRFLPAMLLFGVVALSSCEKSEQDKVTPEFEQGTISQILSDSSKITTYNLAGQLVTQVNHYDKESGELESFEKFERDAKGKLTKATIHAGSNHAVLSEQLYTYSVKGILEKTTSSYYNSGKVEYNTFATYKYSADQRLEKKTVFEGTAASENAKAKSYTTYEALPNGNYTQEKQFVVDDKGNAKLFSTTTYSYDANHNPFFEFAEPGTASSPNNLIAANTVVHGSDKKYKYTYTYTYDQSGYPVSQTVVKPNGERETYTYVYSK
jgi:YD repeat-containing protein